MTVTPSYQVLNISASNADITQKVVSISPATDTGTGEIPMMVMTLDAKNGQFITQSNSGTTPIVDQFTIFKVTFTDQNNISYIRGYLVDTFKQLQNLNVGNRLEVHCFGMEYWLQRLDFAKQYYYADASSTFADLCDKYNLNKGSLQPTIINQRNKTFNQLPVWTANIYLFNVTELTVYSGQSEVVDKLGTSVQNGGAADFFEMKYMNGDVSAGGYPGSGIDFNKITPIVVSSGLSPAVKVDERAPANPLIITPSNSIKITEIDGTVEAQQGTLIKAFGDDQSGSLPVAFSQFRGTDEAYFLFPDWQNPATTGQPYPQNALVGFDPGTGRQVYKSNINSNSSTPPTNWTIQSESDILTTNGITQYSPWTNGGSSLSALQSCMADPSSLAYGACGFDSNLVVQDGDYYRTWADIREVSDTLVPSTYKIRDHSNVPQFYRGFRILIDLTLGTKGGVFAQNSGKDRFGNSYDNALVQNNGLGSGTYQDWDCVWTRTNPPKASAFLLNVPFQCAILAEAKNYVFGVAGITPWDSGKTYAINSTVSYNGSYYKSTSTVSGPPPPPSNPAHWALQTPAWADNSGSIKGNDCFHKRGSFNNTIGTSTVPKNGGGTYGDTSAINLFYTWTPLNSLLGIVFTTPNYYQAGWWFNMRVPFPSTVLVGSTPVGSLYGGYQNANQNNLALEPATVDVLNMHLTHSGNSGFNQVDSEDLATLYGLGLQMKMRLQDDSANLMVGPTGTFANFKMRCYLFDTSDNVVYHDFTIAFNDVWQDIVLPFQSFQIYRGRIPLTFGDINALTPIPQLNILNVFFWRNIKQIVIQCQNVYDDQGRYKPETSDINNFALQATLIPGNPSFGKNAQLVGFIDALRFIKPLLCTSGVATGYVIEPETLQRKNMTNYFQLKQDVLSMLEIYNFRRREYEITMNLNCFVRFGDTFYLRNSNVVETQTPPDVAPDGSGTNTIKLVCKNASYYLNKTDGGPGGLITVLRGVKRYPKT